MHRLRRKDSRARRRERGVALLVVLATLALVAAVVADFQFNARVDMQLAYNARDALQAEYNALSALRVRSLILRHARRLDSATQALAPAMGIDASMMPPIGQILDMVPVECGFMSAIIREVDNELAVGETGDRSDDGESADFFPGECSAISESEHTKISINVLAKRTGGADKQVTRLLFGFLSNPAFERHFDEDDLNGVHAEDPQELIAAIADWIDRDKNQTGNLVADEDRHYAYLRDSYKPKNAPFDSLAELQLVHGVDDELYDILKDNVTVHNDGTQIELATAPLDRIWWGLLGSVREGVNAGELLIHPGVRELQRLLAEMRMIGGAGFSVLKVETLISLIQTTGLDSIIDIGQVREVFTDKTINTWYTITATGRVGNATRKITAVFQAVEGRYYHVRVE
jgi:general secretion pathway protein K